MARWCIIQIRRSTGPWLLSPSSTISSITKLHHKNVNKYEMRGRGGGRGGWRGGEQRSAPWKSMRSLWWLWFSSAISFCLCAYRSRSFLFTTFWICRDRHKQQQKSITNSHLTATIFHRVQLQPTCPVNCWSTHYKLSLLKTKDIHPLHKMPFKCLLHALIESGLAVLGIPIFKMEPIFYLSHFQSVVSYAVSLSSHKAHSFQTVH